MHTATRIATLSALFLVACSHAEEPVSPEPATPVSADVSYRGELILHGDPALLGAASASISIVAAGGDAPVLARTWDLGDPAWRVGAGEMRLYFAIDARDAWPGRTTAMQDRMDLVARFDPDGNPATDEPGVVQRRVSVARAARDLHVELTLGGPVASTELPSDG